MRTTSNEYSDSWLETLFPPSPLIPKETGTRKLVSRYSSATVPGSHGVPHFDAHFPSGCVGNFACATLSEAKFAKNRCDF